MSPSSAGRVGAFDGLRAVAVSAVIVYHLWPDRLPSGFLGVDMFMVLSGYLITSLLVREHARSGAIRLRAFWGRRFRRLIPALMLMLAVVAIFVRVAGPDTLDRSVRQQGLAALFYVANWKLVLDGVSYGALNSARSPLLHLWSLGIEEQFYVVWPLVLLALFRTAAGRRHALKVAVAGALGSAALMAVWYRPGTDPLRLYYGTDTRAQALLLGAAAALIAPRLRLGHRKALAVIGPIAFAAVLFAMLTNSPNVLYRGGFGLVALGTACAVLAAAETGPLTQMLDHAPLRGLGRISYGVYLWHWPAITLLTAARVGVSGAALVVVQLGVTLLAALASWFVVERPVAHFQPRRVAVAGAALVAAATAALVALPATELVAYASVQTGRVVAPVIAAPVNAVPRSPAPVRMPPPTTRVPAPTRAPSMGAPSTRPRPTSLPPPAQVVNFTMPPTGSVMIVGDSGTFDLTPPLVAGFTRAGRQVVATAYPGIGLSSPGPPQFASWANNVRDYHVTLTIVLLGGWDVGWEKSHGGVAYQRLVDAAVHTFTAQGGKVLWLAILPGGSPAPRPLDSFYAALPARFPGVVSYADPEAVLRGPKGDYPKVVDGQLYRKPDGWHLCPAGAAALARFVFAHVGVDAGNLDVGDWRTDPRYNDPPHGCDVTG